MSHLHSSRSTREQRSGTRRSSSIAQPAVLGALALSLACLLGLGCVPRAEIIINGDVEFSAEHLRPNLAPYGYQLPPPSPFYSDGNSYDSDSGRMLGDGTERVSELYFSNIPGDKLAQLHRSKCFWVEQGAENPIVSYETIFRDVNLPEVEAYWDQVSVCATGPRDPRTREPIMYYDDGEPVSAGHVWRLSSMDVMLTASRGNNRDPYHSCELEMDADSRHSGDVGDPNFQPHSQTLRRRQMSKVSPLGVGFSAMPLCSIRGATSPVEEDTSYSLDLVNVPLGEGIEVDDVELTLSPGSDITPHTHHLEPRVKVVERRTPQDPFTVVRQMVWRDETPEVEDDRTKLRQRWSWQVPIDVHTGVWHENFSFNLEVIRIAVFTHGDWDDAKGEHERVYLSPRRIRAYAGGYDGSAQENKLFTCDTEVEGDGGPRACEEIFGFTPTYSHALPSQWLTWVAQFRRVTQSRPCGPGEGTGICEEVTEDTMIDEKDPVFIEFTVVNSAEFGTSVSGLTASPVNGGHFGNVWVSDRPSLDNAIWLQNYSKGNVLVEEIGFDGPDAADFSARVNVAGGAPFILAPDRAVAVSLNFASKTMGEKSAMLYVRSRSSQGQVDDIFLPVTANAVDYVFEALSGNLEGFVRDALGYAEEVDFSKALALVNNGAFPMPRGAIWIEGFNADAFSVVTDEPRGWDPLSYGIYEPWRDGGAPPAQALVDPGRDERLYVVYHPQDGYRNYSQAVIPDVAELVVEIGNEEHRMPLRGTCYGDCSFAPPKPPESGGSTTGGGSTTPLNTVGSSPTPTLKK